MVAEWLVESEDAASVEDDGDRGGDELRDAGNAKRIVGAELARVVAGQVSSRARPGSVESRDFELRHGARSTGAHLRLERPLQRLFGSFQRVLSVVCTPDRPP